MILQRSMFGLGFTTEVHRLQNATSRIGRISTVTGDKIGRRVGWVGDAGTHIFQPVLLRMSRQDQHPWSLSSRRWHPEEPQGSNWVGRQRYAPEMGAESSAQGSPHQVCYQTFCYCSVTLSVELTRIARPTLSICSCVDSPFNCSTMSIHELLIRTALFPPHLTVHP